MESVVQWVNEIKHFEKLFYPSIPWLALPFVSFLVNLVVRGLGQAVMTAFRISIPSQQLHLLRHLVSLSTFADL
jgi:hypothetical protein